MIDIQHLSKRYTIDTLPFLALDDVSLSIRAGESVAIMGRSGAGKTTLMNIIGCLDTFDEGSYQLDGVNVAALSDEKLAHLRNEKIGFVMQDFALLPHKSVLFNVMLPMYFDQTPRREMVSKAKTVLEKLGMSAQEKKRVNQLSGGQKQRAAVARAIITNPRLLLADEPTGALDSRATDELLRVFSDISASGQTILMVTHSVRAASRAGRVLFIKDGEVCHQLYRGGMTDDQLYQKITDALTVLQAGGERV